MAIERKTTIMLADKLNDLTQTLFRKPDLNIRQIKFADQPPCYSISMKYRSIFFQSQTFKSMPHGMSQIQRLTNALFFRIYFHNVLLDLY